MPLQQLRNIMSLQHLPTSTKIKCKYLGLIKWRQLWLMKVNLIWLTWTCHGQPTLTTHRCLYPIHLQSLRCVHCSEMGHTHPLWSSMEWISPLPTDHGSCQSRPDTSAHSWSAIIRYRQENPVDMARWVWGKTICYTDWRSTHRNGHVWWLAWRKWLEPGGMWWLQPILQRRGVRSVCRKVHTHPEVNGLVKLQQQSCSFSFTGRMLTINSTHQTMNNYALMSGASRWHPSILISTTG